MTTLTSGSMNGPGHHPSAENPAIDEALGWEGHVNIPPSPILAKLLRHWSERQTGMAFSLVFLIGFLAGGILFAALSSGKRNS